MSDLLSDLLARGQEAVKQICDDRMEETLHLEFKTLSDTSGSPINKADRKTLSEAICALANAEGGIVLVGVATQRVDGLDVADSPAPISNIARFRNRVASLLPDLLSPAHSGVVAHQIRATGDDGYLAVEVPISEGRPHMSNPHHQYFRRGSDRTRVMEHGEVRDLFFAGREARLKVESRIALAAIKGNQTRQFYVFFGVRNVGQIAARNEFMRMRSMSGTRLALVTLGLASGQERPDGSVMFMAREIPVLHVDDLNELARAEVTLTPIVSKRDASDGGAPTLTVQEMRSARLWQFSGLRASDTTMHPIDRVAFRIQYGAENALAQEVEIVFSPEALLEHLNLGESELNQIFQQ